MADDLDFDEELLQVAVAGNKRARATGSDDDDLFGSEIEDEGDRRRGGAGAGPSKKRVAPAVGGGKRAAMAAAARQRKGRKGSDDDGDDGSGSDDMYLNEADREQLENMNELDREMILAEREEARQRQRERQELLKKVDKRDDSAAASKRLSSSRAKAAAVDKDSALRQIQRARQRQEKKAKKKSKSGRGARDWSDDDDDGGDESEDEDEEDEAVSTDEEKGDKSAEEEEEVAEAEVERRERREEPAPPREERARRTYGEDYGMGSEEEEEAEEEADIRTVQVLRSQLEAWFDKPFFNGEKLGGIVLRMAYGGSYMPMELVDVKDGGRAYGFGPRNVQCTKYLVVRDGLGLQHTLPMLNVSNQRIEDAEIERYHRHCDRAKRRPLGRADVERARKCIGEAVNYRWDASQVREVLQAKRAQGLLPVNVAQEKARLRMLILDAEQAQRSEDKARLEDELRKLEERVLQQAASSSQYGMNNINKRNMNINFQNALNNVSNKPQGLPTTAVERKGGADPFSRRTTRSAIYWNTKGKGGGDAPPSASKEEEAKRALLAKLQQPQRLHASMTVMDSAELIALLDLEVDVGLLQGPNASATLARRVLGPKWQQGLSRNQQDLDLTQRQVLTMADWKRRAGDF